MCRSKRWLALFAAGCMMTSSACAESENIYYNEQAQQKASYTTAEVTLGEFEQTYSSEAAAYYPYKHNLRVEVSGARFKEYLITTGDTVTAGTVLMTFTRDIDEVTLEKKRLNLQRSEEAFEQRKATYEQELDSLLIRYSTETDTWERELLSLEMARKEIERDKYILQTEQSIEKARKELAELEEDYAITELVAPVDGEVKILVYKQEGDKIGTGEVLMTITEPHGMIFLVGNSSGYFRYGMDVKMEIGGNSNRIELQGKVVASDMLIPEGRRQNYAFVEVDLTELADVKVTRPMVYSQVYYLNNVLTLPKKAVTLAGGKYYVMKLIDGTPVKRYVNFVMNSQTKSLMLDGVEPGDLVIIE